jgi:hypothetical protein
MGKRYRSKEENNASTRYRRRKEYLHSEDHQPTYLKLEAEKGDKLAKMLLESVYLDEGF